jgi:seryl-tRNA synthetase
MLDLKYVRTNLDLITDTLKNRGYDLDLSRFQHRDKKRRSILARLEDLRYQRNKVSDQIAAMKKDREDASSLISEMKTVSKLARMQMIIRL